MEGQKIHVSVRDYLQNPSNGGYRPRATLPSSITWDGFVPNSGNGQMVGGTNWIEQDLLDQTKYTLDMILKSLDRDEPCSHQHYLDLEKAAQSGNKIVHYHSHGFKTT